MRHEVLSRSVYGGVGDRIPEVTTELSDEATFFLGDAGSLSVTARHTPCHTPGHILFHIAPTAPPAPAGAAAATSADADDMFSVPLTRLTTGSVTYFAVDEEALAARGILFTGDTLFVGGCGNFNKGTAEQMHHALVGVVATLPPSTLVAVGHEYTAGNFKFAAVAEPGNATSAAKAAWVATQEAAGVPTVPSTVGQELATNVFMRLRQEEVVAFAKAEGAKLEGLEGVPAQVEVLRQLRASKSAGRGR